MWLMSIKLASAALDQLFVSDISVLFMCWWLRVDIPFGDSPLFTESLINTKSWSSLQSLVRISFEIPSPQL